MFNPFKKKQIKKEDLVEKIESSDAKIDREISKNVNIYPMPRRFRVAQKQKSQAKTTGIFIMVGGALFLIAISAGAYYYFFRTKPVENTPASMITETPLVEKQEKPAEVIPEPASPAAEEKDPKESYMEMKAEFDKIIDFAGLEAAVLKYGSKNKIEELEKEKNQYETMPDSFKENIVSVLIKNMPKLNEIGEISSAIKGGLATLTISTIDLSKNGTIQMAREDNEWKLESESWTNVESGDGAEDKIIFRDGVDADGDGLTDKEEVALGSDANSMDGDGDGYSDFSEIINLYNPAGAGKLADSDKIKNYLNEVYGYEALYPVALPVAEVGGKDSVIFRSVDNHFIQIIAQANQGGLAIDEWYNQQFGASAAENLSQISGNGWQGIKSEDGLIVYLGDDSLKFIFVITYNPGEQNILEYKNIFEMILKSFTVK
jgi:hypothetical protein